LVPRGLKPIKNPLTGKPYWYKDNADRGRARNVEKNAVSRLAYKIAGSSKEFYKLDRTRSEEIRETAKVLHRTGSDFVTAYKAEATEKRGFVYVIWNPAWPHAIKVGRAFDPESRLRGYQTGTPMRDYSLRYAAYFEDCHKAEKDIHYALRHDRLQGERFQ